MEIKLLLLLMVANGAPVIAWDVFKERFAMPVDKGIRLGDGSPLLGPAKTWRGIMAALIATPLVAWVIGLSWRTAIVIALMAMSGDLFSSFCKRRLGIASSEQALGLDQIPESLFPLLAVKKLCSLDWLSILVLTLTFLVMEITLSPTLYRLGIRKRPY